jgi:CHAT domain-containing protein
LNRLFIFIFICLFCGLSSGSNAAVEDYDSLYKVFSKYYFSGDFLNAERALLNFKDSQFNLTNDQYMGLYNNLSVVCQLLGKFDMALKYNYMAESYIKDSDNRSLNLADIFNNRGNLFSIKKSFDVSVEYVEKSIRIYQEMKMDNIYTVSHLSSAYINISVALIELKKYGEALRYLKKNVVLSSQFKLPTLPLTYLNMAKVYTKMNNISYADKYYKLSISSFFDEYGPDYHKLADVYFDYGIFLLSMGKGDQALSSHRKAMQICTRNYGEKHTIVSLSYKHLAEDYLEMNKIDSSLYYYQKSLIAVSKGFDNQDIFTNPSIDSSLFDIRLLDNLKSKAQALEQYSVSVPDSVSRVKVLHKSLETIDLALQLIDRIRNSYLSEESRVYLAENEKETYVFAIHIADILYHSSGDRSMVFKMYSIVQKAKAAILRNEIAGNDFLYSAGMPDTLREKQKALKGNIGAYNNFLTEESRKIAPDVKKIAFWKDALFEMNRENETVNREIEKAFPQYRHLIQKTEPVPVAIIQKKLGKEESIVDYFLSNQYINGKRRLFIFVITPNNLDFRESLLDSSFAANASIIHNTDISSWGEKTGNNFRDYTGAMHKMYLDLIQPVEKIVKGKRIKIIPDGEISWLPFDAFLKSAPATGQKDFEGLDYLLHEYTFSYGYSSSLMAGSTFRKFFSPSVVAFSPGYPDNVQGKTSPGALHGSESEISSIFNWFPVKEYSNENASKQRFLLLGHDNSILHLAMHSQTDSINSKFSCLLFDENGSSPGANKLFNYEISLSRIKSPMVVLSACNSGTGTLYSSEGQMSLARSFLLAGAASVVKTAWDINDETSSKIIPRFYYYLSRGQEKDEAMRLAKSDYLSAASPAYTNPYYWAAYEVLGDNSAVVKKPLYLMVMLGLFLLFISCLAVFYFRRRKSLAERS